MRQFFCVLCDGFIYKKDTIFCDVCTFKINKTKFKKRKDKLSNHYYLFSWSKENDFFCRTLAYSLKNQPSSHFILLASLFAPVRGFLDSLLVCPDSAKKGPNHAESLSLALKGLFSSSGVLPVKALKNGSQKYKRTRNERFKTVQTFVESVGNWIFVDDVFVTGATCYKISEKLGTKPKLIVTLIYREKEP